MGQIIWRKVSTTHTSGGGQWMGSTYYPRDGQITYEHEYILLLRKPGTGPPPTAAQKERSRLRKEDRSRWFRGVWDDLPPARQKSHVAMFPVELARRLILMYSFHGETILDPFAGSGSALAAAEQEGRNSVGYEINPDFERLIRGKVQPSLLGEGFSLEVRRRID
jgi:site-specific DNA-methyltransferase (adenine-specific)